MKLPVDTLAMAFLCEAGPVVDFEIKRPLGNGRDRRRRSTAAL
jgi:hypothetical protein